MRVSKFEAHILAALSNQVDVDVRGEVVVCDSCLVNKY